MQGICVGKGARGPTSHCRDAFGFSLGSQGQHFRFWVEPATIEGFDDHRQLDVYRDGNLLINLDLDGSAGAITAMNACHAALAEADRAANLAMEQADLEASEEAADAVETAANAAEAAADAKEQDPPLR